MTSEHTLPVYEYATDNSKALEAIANWCNTRSETGWEFVTLVVDHSGRYVGLFRRPKYTARCSKCGASVAENERFCAQCGAQR